MATMRNFGLMSDKFKIYPCLALDIIIFRWVLYIRAT